MRLFCKILLLLILLSSNAEAILLSAANTENAVLNSAENTLVQVSTGKTKQKSVKKQEEPERILSIYGNGGEFIVTTTKGVKIYSKENRPPVKGWWEVGVNAILLSLPPINSAEQTKRAPQQSAPSDIEIAQRVKKSAESQKDVPDYSSSRRITGLVIATRSGEKYHKASCPTLNRTPDEFLRSVTRDEAIKEGYDACKVCKP